MIAITANAPPAGYVFDRWTGATASVSNVMAASTYVTMAAQDMSIAATYRVDPALDTDGDGIGDLCDNLPNTPNPGQGDDDDDTTGDPDPADHFQCYEIKPAFQAPIAVTAESQFGPLNQTLRFPHRLCAPTDKNQEGIMDPVQHLTGYSTRVSTTVFKRLRQQIVNQFGSILLDVVRADMLLVPTAKNGVPLPPDTIDHFQCYKVKRTRGTAKFVPISGVQIVDGLGSYTAMLVKPRYLCAPADKNGEDPGAETHDPHLLCYKTRLPRLTTIVNQFVTKQCGNQLGEQAFDLIRRVEFCVPSQKNPTTTTTSSTPTTTSTTSTSSTTLYGSPSRAFLDRVMGLLD
jgi:hypothetical protein